MRNELNLRKLADYLESLPIDYRDFGMSDYLLPRSGGAVVNYALANGGVHTCGTAACAIGHGPSAGILFPPFRERPELWSRGGYVYPTGNVNNPQWEPQQLMPAWSAYSYEFFIENHGDEWEWCFGSGWSRVDNHHWGAAARIRWLLAGNVPPQLDLYDDDDELSNFDSDYADEDHVALYARYRKTGE